MFSRQQAKRMGWAIVVAAMLTSQLAAQFWQADPGFAPVLGSPALEPPVTAFVRQPGGKFIVAGLLERVNGEVPPVQTVRLNADGSTDKSFFAAVAASTNILLQPSGRIVVGNASSAVRLNADGSLDATFNPAHDLGNVGAMDATGRLYAARSDGTLARFDVNGVLDAGYRPAAVSILKVAGRAHWWRRSQMARWWWRLRPTRPVNRLWRAFWPMGPATRISWRVDFRRRCSA